MFDITSAVGARGFYLPFLFDPIFELSPTGRKHRRAVKQSHDFTQSVIRARRRAVAEHGEDKDKKYVDFLDILLRARVCNTSSCSSNFEKTQMRNTIFILLGLYWPYTLVYLRKYEKCVKLKRKNT